MIPVTDPIELEIHSGIELKSQGFEVDAATAIRLLTVNLYKSTPVAVMREYACNARDANRENGKPLVPIRIKMPSGIDPVLHISDDGIGIDPERMEKYFRRLGGSTKREENVSTGGFGIGCTVGFAYGTSFIVDTKTKDGKQRIYQCILDDERGAVVYMLAETPSDGTTGTTIRIPTKSKDFLWSAEFERIFYAWDVRPLIDIEQESHKEAPFATPTRALGTSHIFVEHPDFYIIPSMGSNISHKLVIDGILYDNPLETYKPNVRVIPRFGNGVLRLLISRDGIDQSDHNRQALESWMEAHAELIAEQIDDTLCSRMEDGWLRCFISQGSNNLQLLYACPRLLKKTISQLHANFQFCVRSSSGRSRQFTWDSEVDFNNTRLSSLSDVFAESDVSLKQISAHLKNWTDRTVYVPVAKDTADPAVVKRLFHGATVIKKEPKAKRERKEPSSTSAKLYAQMSSYNCYTERKYKSMWEWRRHYVIRCDDSALTSNGRIADYDTILTFANSIQMSYRQFRDIVSIAPNTLKSDLWVITNRQAKKLEEGSYKLFDPTTLCEHAVAFFKALSGPYGMLNTSGRYVVSKLCSHLKYVVPYCRDDRGTPNSSHVIIENQPAQSILKQFGHLVTDAETEAINEMSRIVGMMHVELMDKNITDKIVKWGEENYVRTIYALAGESIECPVVYKKKYRRKHKVPNQQETAQ